ncbi:MAG: VWA domain-containing protein [Gemmataceae bacterium]|nr:VWA domain-containing protein [Gemmataceae bacterium]MCI0742138.1 VWA domain-containing protein [Gemmataceae bacterium]
MTFLYGPVLVTLVVPAALILWQWRQGRRSLALPFDHGKPGKGRAWWVFLSLADNLPALVLAVVIILLAGPIRLGEPKDKRSLTNIELCVDVSGSMTAIFGEGTRYDTSMKAIDSFLTYRKGDAFGLTFFGNNYLHFVPLTSDVSAIRCAPPFMRPEVAPPWMGGTEIGKALRACKKVLAERHEGDRMVLLISDGDSFDLGGGVDLAVGKELKDNNIVVYHIHISDVRIPDSMINITSITGGEVFNPGDPEALKEVFKKIDQMQKTKVEKTIGDTLDDFWLYCVIGLSLAGTLLLSWFGARYTPW